MLSLVSKMVILLHFTIIKDQYKNFIEPKKESMQERNFLPCNEDNYILVVYNDKILLDMCEKRSFGNL